MHIGIIGSGKIGGTLAAHFATAGHEVAIANSRGPETLRELEAELGGHVHAVTAREAAEFGEVTVVAIPFGRYTDLPSGAFDGQIVIDTCNYYPDRDGHRADLDRDATTSSELLQEVLPGSRVVKAFNAIRFDDLREQARRDGAQGRRAIPVSGDDAEAKTVVGALIDQIGFEPVDVGTLAEGGRRHQPGTAVYTVDLNAQQLREQLESAPKHP
ncbi:NADPH-dependent F420 reductase [Actinospica sp. MGRD01-02]|uniref:NADPH-dependent F420 reductase n=1 Tax=Actinospica acidithermotolerans TaxID=2828514 RepID=A0A941EHD6_9ACTN|nr:NADPH-dependent F420 reductase [Actinospica acidithermotolerans]